MMSRAYSTLLRIILKNNIVSCLQYTVENNIVTGLQYTAKNNPEKKTFFFRATTDDC